MMNSSSVLPIAEGGFFESPSNLLNDLGPRAHVVYFPFLVFLVTYWIPGLALFLLEHCQWPQCLYKYKIQPDRRLGIPASRLFGFCLSSNLVLFAQLELWFRFARGTRFCLRVDDSLPGLQEVLTNFAVFLLCEEVVFYHMHRLGHYFMYRHIHKIHHEARAPVYLCVIYCHPLEMALCNGLSVCMGPALCGAHYLTFCLWVVVVIVGAGVHHSGYRFPWHPPFDHQPDFHDFHHSHNVGCFGILSVLDKLYGTDRLWKEKLEKSKLETSKTL